MWRSAGSLSAGVYGVHGGVDDGGSARTRDSGRQEKDGGVGAPVGEGHDESREGE